jgi:hypothetical protein
LNTVWARVKTAAKTRTKMAVEALSWMSMTAAAQLKGWVGS